VFKSIFCNKKTFFKKKTFTYYVPSPPLRKTGYQEREFDSIMEYIVNLGFDIIDFKMESHATEGKSGLWIVCLLGANTEAIYNTKIEFTHDDINNGPLSTTNEIPLDPSIIHDR